jgi:quercetin dioxygenase-like cupin family protein
MEAQSMAGSKYFTQQALCSKHNIFPGVDIFSACGEKLMLSLVELEPHSRVELHSHPHEQVGLLLEGEFEFTIGEETRRLRPGDMWRIPGGVLHGVVNGDRPSRALDVFCPIREDYR